MEKRTIVLFDGVCNLCNSSVAYIIRKDIKKKFYFASLQSEVGKQLLQSVGFSEQHRSSLVLIEEGRGYAKSTAALKIARHLDGWVKACVLFRFIPRPIRDVGYDIIAKHRYQWFGMKDSCMLPTPEVRKRFLD